ncbi:hypothetical protein VST7929_02957 [Vibrio stylophorae]|uniref:Uncharacterized protein n=1 Tax=Vibrio stylophorae TaxID=659351 RepID=A0ABM8ZXA2_9VIBR|nr:hypothetical protein [Vibrio stylophorae]CAH0535384.1 hypothetical protein VST7929_02957 [Vibrio stylophorae]
MAKGLKYFTVVLLILTSFIAGVQVGRQEGESTTLQMISSNRIPSILVHLIDSSEALKFIDEGEYERVRNRLDLYVGTWLVQAINMLLYLPGKDKQNACLVLNKIHAHRTKYIEQYRSGFMNQRLEEAMSSRELCGT